MFLSERISPNCDCLERRAPNATRVPANAELTAEHSAKHAVSSVEINKMQSAGLNSEGKLIQTSHAQFRKFKATFF